MIVLDDELKRYINNLKLRIDTLEMVNKQINSELDETNLKLEKILKEKEKLSEKIKDIEFIPNVKEINDKRKIYIIANSEKQNPDEYAKKYNLGWIEALRWILEKYDRRGKSEK